MDAAIDMNDRVSFANLCRDSILVSDSYKYYL